MNDQEQSNNGTSPGSSEPKKRINTQIHRRSKAKAVYPLSDEWEDSSSSAPPKQLRMPSSNMKKTGQDGSKESKEP
ncbi:MAG: hypothetical protein NPIRA02_14080 [Nitrospirales bacterium]|nr:MAG: hypothetical protein NPIRA02_14080 [Nitrospirales bacterium]